MDHFSHTKAIPPLEPHLYALDTESLAFFMSTTGIYDEDELKAHILDVQRQAYDACAQGGLFIYNLFLISCLLSR